MSKFSTRTDYLERLGIAYRKHVENLGHESLSQLYLCFNEILESHNRTIIELCDELDKTNLNIKLSVNRRLDNMDKQINKVKRDVEKNNKPKAKKDIKKLLKMDKKFDAKLEKCGIEEKSKKKAK
jgi:hypothetical protein